MFEQQEQEVIQEELPPQAFQDPNAFATMQRGKELQNLALWELNPQDVLESLDHYYRGEVYDGKEWVKKHTGYLDPDSAGKLISFISSYVNKINFLNDYEESDILHRCWEARKAVANWLRYNYKRAGIDKRNFDLILLPTDAMIYGAYKKSYKGGERKFLGSVHNTSETTLRNPQSKGKLLGIFG